MIRRTLMTLVTAMMIPSLAVAQTDANDAAAIEAWLKGYDAAFLAKDLKGLETLMLIKTPEGWKIRHSHTSGRARRPAQ